MEITISPEDVNEIYDELDLSEEGITEDEIMRRKTRLFVGGLKFATEDPELRNYFEKFGEPKEAVIIRDRKTGLSKGYGFVTFLDEKDALKAISDKSPKIDGRRCNVNLAYIGQKKKPPSKKPEMRLSEIPSLTQQMYNLNGYPMSPTIVTPTGQLYQLGLPPLHGHQPVYHFPPTPSPVFEPIENLPGHSPMSPMYPQPIFFSHPYIINNHLSAINNNVIPASSGNYYPVTTSEQTGDMNNNNNITNGDLPVSNIVSINNSNNVINSPKTVAMTTKSPPESYIVSQKPLTDPIVVTASNDNNNNIINYGNQIKNMPEQKILLSDVPTCLPQSTPLFTGRYIISNKPIQLNNNANIINNNTLMNTNNMIDINGNTPLMKPATFMNNTQNHLINGTNHVTPEPLPQQQNQQFPVDSVDTLIPCQSSVTTYISSPLPSPLIHSANHIPVYQFHPYIQTPKDIQTAM